MRATRRGAQGPAGEQRRRQLSRGIGRDLLPWVDAWLIRILTRSLHPGRWHSARHNAHTLLHSFRRDSWRASSRKAKVLTQGHVGSKLRSDKPARPQSRRSLPASGWNETWAEWRERGGRGTQGTRPRSQMLTGRATEGFYSHHDTLLLYRDTWVPRQLWLGAHLQFRNLPNLLPLFVKKKKKNEAGGNRGGHFSLSRRLGDSWHYQPWLRVSRNSNRRLTISLVSASLAKVRVIVKRLAGSKIWITLQAESIREWLEPQVHFLWPLSILASAFQTCFFTNESSSLPKEVNYVKERKL